MAGRWECSKQREMDLFIEEMAREMYLRDWKRAMKDAHWVIQAFHKFEPDYENLKISFRNYDNSLNYNGTTPFGAFYLSK